MGDSRKGYCNVCNKTIITKHSVSERFSKNKNLSVKAKEHFEWSQIRLLDVTASGSTQNRIKNTNLSSYKPVRLKLCSVGWGWTLFYKHMWPFERDKNYTL